MPPQCTIVVSDNGDKHPRSPSPASVLPTPSPSPTLPLVHTPAPPPVAPLPTPPPAPPAEMAPYLVPPSPAAETLDLSSRSNGEVAAQKVEGPLRTSTPEPTKRSSNPLDVCNLTAKDPPKSPPKKRHLNNLDNRPHPAPKLWSPADNIERHPQEPKKRRVVMAGEIDYSLPITTTYLKYMRSLGCTDEDALKFENKHVSGTPERTSALSGALSKLNGIRRIDNNRCGVTGCSTPKVQTVQTHDRSHCLSTCLSEGLRINSPYGSCSVRHSRSALIAPLSFLHLDNSTSKIGGVSDRDVD
ncbi:hypothetical protein GEV33_012488 [Tenebrio molitor]|uniref:Uncharacterized protein n=1 Tax=Tenebrio molitor TaxID=7067 RepID=A0A8J6H9F9_TENMO|nr:hypothetical protein GEV33_012488 [Tenebrio molitor]